MKISTDNCLKKERCTENSSHNPSRYILGSLLVKLQVMQLFPKLTPLQVFLKKFDQSLS